MDIPGEGKGAHFTNQWRKVSWGWFEAHNGSISTIPTNSLPPPSTSSINPQLARTPWYFWPALGHPFASKVVSTFLQLTLGECNKSTEPLNQIYWKADILRPQDNSFSLSSPYSTTHICSFVCSVNIYWIQSMLDTENTTVDKRNADPDNQSWETNEQHRML